MLGLQNLVFLMAFIAHLNYPLALQVISCTSLSSTWHLSSLTCGAHGLAFVCTTVLALGHGLYLLGTSGSLTERPLHRWQNICLLPLAGHLKILRRKSQVVTRPGSFSTICMVRVLDFSSILYPSHTTLTFANLFGVLTLFFVPCNFAFWPFLQAVYHRTIASDNIRCRSANICLIRHVATNDCPPLMNHPYCHQVHLHSFVLTIVARVSRSLRLGTSDDQSVSTSSDGTYMCLSLLSVHSYNLDNSICCHPSPLTLHTLQILIYHLPNHLPATFLPILDSKFT